MAENVRREHGSDPVGGQVQGRLAADCAGVHDQRVEGSVDGLKAVADRAQVGDVHDNDVEDAPAGLRFELGLRRCRPVLVPARQVDAGHIGT